MAHAPCMLSTLVYAYARTHAGTRIKRGGPARTYTEVCNTAFPWYLWSDERATMTFHVLTEVHFSVWHCWRAVWRSTRALPRHVFLYTFHRLHGTRLSTLYIYEVRHADCRETYKYSVALFWNRISWIPSRMDNTSVKYGYGYKLIYTLNEILFTASIFRNLVYH